MSNRTNVKGVICRLSAPWDTRAVSPEWLDEHAGVGFAVWGEQDGLCVSGAAVPRITRYTVPATMQAVLRGTPELMETTGVLYTRELLWTVPGLDICLAEGPAVSRTLALATSMECPPAAIPPGLLDHLLVHPRFRIHEYDRCLPDDPSSRKTYVRFPLIPVILDPAAIRPEDRGEADPRPVMRAHGEFDMHTGKHIPFVLTLEGELLTATLDDQSALAALLCELDALTILPGIQGDLH